MSQSEPSCAPQQAHPQETPPSSNPSTYTYTFDTDGDTEIILTTNTHNPFNWEDETLWVGRSRPSADPARKRRRTESGQTMVHTLTPALNIGRQFQHSSANRSHYCAASLPRVPPHACQQRVPRPPTTQLPNTRPSEQTIAGQQVHPPQQAHPPQGAVSSAQETIQAPLGAHSDLGFLTASSQIRDDSSAGSDATGNQHSGKSVVATGSNAMSNQQTGNGVAGLLAPPNTSAREDSENAGNQSTNSRSAERLRIDTSSEQIEVRMLVSKKHLMLTSSYFEKMFNGPFAEAEANAQGLRQVKASDWDLEAFSILMNIVHGHHRRVPSSLTLETLAKLVLIVDYYEFHETINIYLDHWLTHFEHGLPQKYGRDSMLLLLIVCVIPRKVVFGSMTYLALHYSTGLIKVQELPIPDLLLITIDKERKRVVDRVFGKLYSFLDCLLENSPCCSGCSTMAVGAYIKNLKEHGILTPYTGMTDEFSLSRCRKMIPNIIELPERSVCSGQWRGPKRDLCNIRAYFEAYFHAVGVREIRMEDFHLREVKPVTSTTTSTIIKAGLLRASLGPLDKPSLSLYDV